MWKKYGKAGQATDDNIIRRMRFVCWVTKATDTISECVTLTALARQKWLRERPSILGYAYIACLQHRILKLSRHFLIYFPKCPSFSTIKSMPQTQHFTSFFRKVKSTLLVNRILFLLNVVIMLAKYLKYCIFSGCF
jgi:hypothetical protein